MTTGEMGVRLALGATPRQVALLLLRGGLAGVLGAVWAATTMRGLLYEVDLFDLTAFTGAMGVLGTVMFPASLIPARQVASVDPVSVLKAS